MPAFMSGSAARNRSCQQRVQLDGRLGGAKRRPLEQAQTQIDGGGVQRIDAGIEFQHRRLLGIQRSGPHDQSLSQRVVDAPVSLIQRVGQRRARRWRLQPHVEQLGLIGRQARLDVAQRLVPGELREGHHAKQVGAAQRAHTRVALVPLDDSAKVFQGTNSITCANSVLPTFMRHSGSLKPASIANRRSEIQIVDTHESLETRVSTGFAAG
jgi:hypothetical protein